MDGWKTPNVNRFIHILYIYNTIQCYIMLCYIVLYFIIFYYIYTLVKCIYVLIIYDMLYIYDILCYIIYVLIIYDMLYIYIYLHGGFSSLIHQRDGNLDTESCTVLLVKSVFSSGFQRFGIFSYKKSHL